MMQENETLSGLQAEIKAHSILVKYNAGELIFKQNTPITQVYLISNGLVKVYKATKNHRETIISVNGPGDFLGIMTLWNNKINAFNAVAIDDTDIFLIEEDILKNLLLNEQKYFDLLLNIISSQSIDIINRLITINQKQLPGRVADLILYFHSFYNESYTFKLPLSRKELAQLTGTTKESLIRTLAEFKNDRIIELNNREVHINSMEIIKTLSRLG